MSDVPGMGVLVGLLLGIGSFVVWWSCWTPGPSRERSAGGRYDRARDTLAQAGLPSVSPHALGVSCAGAGFTAFLAVLAVSQVPAIAVCFGVMVAWLPVALVRGRARRRRAQLRDAWPEVVDNLVSGVRAGLSLPEALAHSSVDSVAGWSPRPAV